MYIYMGCRRDRLILLIVLNAWLWQLIEGSQTYNRDSLDSFLYDYAFKKIKRLRSGEAYEVVPPANFSGMEVAVVRVRTSSLWNKGFSYGSLVVPPDILPWPFTNRVDIVYQNLGNWSSYYYAVPNHTFVAPVIGFLAYDSNRKNENVELRAKGDEPLIVNFTNIHTNGGGGVTMRCVRFDSNGTLEFSSVSMESSCVVREQGHFSVVVPYVAKEEDSKSSSKIQEWWIMGIAAGALGLMWLVFIIVGCKKIRKRKIRKMEEVSERSEGLDTIWIGRSRMPFASGIRTQTVLENSYLP